MVELLSRLNGGDLTAVLLVAASLLMATLIALGTSVISAVQRHYGQVIASSVVAQMLDRGAAPQEIVAVLKAMGLETPPDRRRLSLRERLVGASAEKDVA